MGNEVSMQSGRAEEVALMKAVLAGDVPSMQALLQQKPGLIYAHSKDGENIWHAAAQGGHPEVAKAVHAAVEAALSGQKKQDKLRAQVNHGFNQVHQAVNQVIQASVPLPIPAALNLPMGSSLDINAQTRTGLTPLMAAAKAGQADMVTTLLELGADAWRGDNSGATALHHAAWCGAVPCVEVLLAHGAQQDEGKGGAPGDTSSSSSNGRGRLVEAGTNTGLTPLHWAAWKGQVEVVKLLVNAGACIAAPSSSDTMGAVAANTGSTPLHLAAMKGEVGVVRLLLRANKKLMALATTDPALAAAAAAEPGSGALQDLRAVADAYGKTAGRLAWDMQRSDLALILDPQTPLDQAITLATTAAKTAAAAASEAPAAQQISRPDPQQQQQQQQKDAPGSPAAVRSSSSIKRSPGGSAVTAATAVTAVAVTAATAAATAAAATAATAAATAAAATAATAAAAPIAAAGGGGAEDDGFEAFVSAPRREGPEPPAHLTCPITNELMKDPVRACDGVAYERDAIEVWFQLGNTLFPGRHAPIRRRELTPDEKEADAWREANTTSA